MVSTSGQDSSEKPIGPQTPPNSQLNREIDNFEISDEAFEEGHTQIISTAANQQNETNSELSTGASNTDQNSVDISKLIRAPPPPVSRSVIVQALYLLIENHNNKEKQTTLDEYTITCRLRSRTSTSNGKEGVVARHLNGPFNQTNHIFSASRLRDLEKRGRAKLVSSNARYEEIQQPVPMNLFTLIRIASDRLNFSPNYTIELADRLHKSKLITNPRTFAKAYPLGFPNEDFIKSIIKQADEICKLRVDTRIILANFNRPKCRDLRSFVSNSTKFINSRNSPPIHPCILASNENAEIMLDQCLEGDEMELLKLICQYFFATCHQPFTYSVHTFEFETGPERFMCECQVLATPGFTIHLPWMRPKNVSDHLPEEFRKKNPSREYYVNDVKKVDLPRDETNECILESDFIELLEKRAVGNSLILDTLNALVELKLINIIGPGRRIMPSANGLELMEQEYRKKIDQIGDESNNFTENVSQVEPNIGDAQANSTSHSSLASTNTVSSVSNNIENFTSINNKKISSIAIPFQRNFGFRQRNLESAHSEFSDSSTRISISDIQNQQQYFPCQQQQFQQSKLTLEQQNEQQSTPQLLQKLHIGRKEVSEQNFNKERDSHHKISFAAPSSHRDSLSRNRTRLERENIRNNILDFEEGNFKKEFSGSENPSPTKSEILNPRRLSWMAIITSIQQTSLKKNITATPRRNNERNCSSSFKCSNSNFNFSATDDDFGRYSNKRVRFESPRPRRSVSMAPIERKNDNNNNNDLFNFNNRIKQISSGSSNNNSSKEFQQRTRTSRCRSPSPERRRRPSSFRDWCNKDKKKDYSRHRDRDRHQNNNNNNNRNDSKPSSSSLLGSKRSSLDDINSPIKSFKQQLLIQQKEKSEKKINDSSKDYYSQKHRQSRYDNHFSRGHRDRDWRDSKTQSHQSQRSSHSRFCHKDSLSQSFSYGNSSNNNNSRRHHYHHQQQQESNKNNKRGHCYQNEQQQQQFISSQEQIIPPKIHPLIGATEDISTIPPKRGKWIWVDDK